MPMLKPHSAVPFHPLSPLFQSRPSAAGAHARGRRGRRADGRSEPPPQGPHPPSRHPGGHLGRRWPPCTEAPAMHRKGGAGRSPSRLFCCFQVNDECANVLVAQLLYLANEDPEADITLYINRYPPPPTHTHFPPLSLARASRLSGISTAQPVAYT